MCDYIHKYKSHIQINPIIVKKDQELKNTQLK